MFNIYVVPPPKSPSRNFWTFIITNISKGKSGKHSSNLQMSIGGISGEIGIFDSLSISSHIHTNKKSIPIAIATAFPGTSQHLLSHRSESVIYPFARPKTEWEKDGAGDGVGEQVQNRRERMRERERHRRSRMMSLCLTTKHEISTATLLVCSKLQASETKMTKKRANEREKDKERQLASLTASEIRHITRMTVQAVS